MPTINAEQLADQKVVKDRDEQPATVVRSQDTLPVIEPVEEIASEPIKKITREKDLASPGMTTKPAHSKARKLLSKSTIIRLCIGIVMLFAVFLPWISFAGLRLGLLSVAVFAGLICLLVAISFMGSIFLNKPRIKSLVQITSGIVGLIVFLVVAFVVMPRYARFTESVVELFGIGIWIFVITVIAAIVNGFLELRQSEGMDASTI